MDGPRIVLGQGHGLPGRAPRATDSGNFGQQPHDFMITPADADRTRKTDRDTACAGLECPIPPLAWGETTTAGQPDAPGLT